MELPIDLYIRRAMWEHAEEGAEFNREVCGLLTLSKGYVRSKNISEEGDRFQFTPNVSFQILNDPDVIGYFHSHPQGALMPTKLDMEIQSQVEKPSLILAKHTDTGVWELFQFGDHLLDMPLVGQSFRLNVYDCYESVRRYMWQRRQVKLSAFPRNPYFWMEEPPNPMFDKHFEAEGFEEFNETKTMPQPGDAVLYQTDGVKVINHCAIYIGNNCIFHHRVGKKSSISPMTMYRSAGYLRKWLRYTGVKK